MKKKYQVLLSIFFSWTFILFIRRNDFGATGGFCRDASSIAFSRDIVEMPQYKCIVKRANRTGLNFRSFKLFEGPIVAFDSKTRPQAPKIKIFKK